MAEIIEPSIPMDPACKLFRDGDKKLGTQSMISKIWIPFGCGLIPVLGGLLNNVIRKRPLYASLHRTVFLGAAGLVAGFYLRDYKYRVQAERDLMIYHYMTLHPEDFPPPERVKHRDLLKRWNPIR